MIVFQHEDDLFIILTTDTIGIEKLKLNHLHTSTTSQLKKVLESYKSFFGTSKFDLGCFNGFEVEAEIIPKPSVRCKQPPRNKILHRIVWITSTNMWMQDSSSPVSRPRMHFALSALMPLALQNKLRLTNTFSNSRMIQIPYTGPQWIFVRSIAVRNPQEQ